VKEIILTANGHVHFLTFFENSHFDDKLFSEMVDLSSLLIQKWPYDVSVSMFSIPLERASGLGISANFL
jgi:hypothetical protein